MRLWPSDRNASVWHFCDPPVLAGWWRRPEFRVPSIRMPYCEMPRLDVLPSDPLGPIPVQHIEMRRTTIITAAPERARLPECWTGDEVDVERMRQLTDVFTPAPEAATYTRAGAGSLTMADIDHAVRLVETASSRGFTLDMLRAAREELPRADYERLRRDHFATLYGGPRRMGEMAMGTDTGRLSGGGINFAEMERRLYADMVDAGPYQPRRRVRESAPLRPVEDWSEEAQAVIEEHRRTWLGRVEDLPDAQRVTTSRVGATHADEQARHQEDRGERSEPLAPRADFLPALED